jgi:hypothetical protein
MIALTHVACLPDWQTFGKCDIGKLLTTVNWGATSVFCFLLIINKRTLDHQEPLAVNSFLTLLPCTESNQSS